MRACAGPAVPCGRRCRDRLFEQLLRTAEVPAAVDGLRERRKERDARGLVVRKERERALEQVARGVEVDSLEGAQPGC